MDVVPSRLRQTLAEDIETHAQSEAKRRKVRKGTRSCWECKRRKMKCIVDSLVSDAACNGCRRRGSKCVSQEFPEETLLSTDKTQKVYQFVKHAASDGTTSDGRTPTSPTEEGGTTVHGVFSPASKFLAFYKSPEVRIRFVFEPLPISCDCD